MASSSATCGSVECSQPSAGEAVLHFSGDWTLAHFAALEAQLDALKPHLSDSLDVDFDRIGRIDTAGAGLIALALGPSSLHQLAERDRTLPRELRALLDTVSDAVTDIYARPPRKRPNIGFVDMLERIGVGAVRGWHGFLRLCGFIGLTLETGVRMLIRPRRWRITALVNHMEQTGLDAVPIVVLLAFLVGAVIAFLGASALGQAGAAIFTVDLIATIFLRELAVMLTAILLAGRTASAFTAQIGSMKVGEEIDAMRAMGLDPVEHLVLPRVTAMMIVMPLLTFLAMMAGLLGGALVCWFALHISPTLFLTVLRADTPMTFLWLGLGKAPFFGFLIAMIGCLEGFSVHGSTRSVGEHTTSSVVQSIFLLIAMDALVALFFTEMGW